MEVIDDMSMLGDFIEHHLGRRHLNVAQVAARGRISPNTIGHWLNGRVTKTPPRPDSIHRVAVGLVGKDSGPELDRLEAELAWTALVSYGYPLEKPGSRGSGNPAWDAWGRSLSPDEMRTVMNFLSPLMPGKT